LVTWCRLIAAMFALSALAAAPEVATARATIEAGKARGITPKDLFARRVFLRLKPYEQPMESFRKDDSDRYT
jgi:hypothetical protein